MSRNTVTVESAPDKSYAIVKFRGVEIVCDRVTIQHGTSIFLKRETEVARTDSPLPNLTKAIYRAINYFERTTLTITAY